MKATIKRGGELVLSPESEIEAYALNLWILKTKDDLGPDMPPIGTDCKSIPVAQAPSVPPLQPLSR